VYAQLARATIVLMPSRWEGLPVVGVQAAMMARPIVGSDIRGLGEAVLSGQTGTLVTLDDPNALAEASLDLIENPERAVAFGNAARRHALDLFDSARLMDAYESLYRRLASSQGVPPAGSS
jgi:glycosyltransferase involved in cell wall biosynthesis